MGRLRFLRFLLPALLLLLLIGLFLSGQRRPGVHTPSGQAGSDRPRAEDVNFINLVGGSANVTLQADSVEEGEDGRLVARGIRRLELERKDRGPLIVSAQQGEGVGQAGKRVWQFDDEVVIRDPDEGLELHLPRVEVDEVAGEVRASGAIELSGTSLAGQASRLRYGWHDQPSELENPSFRDGSGASLSASSALLHDGTRDMELAGSVRAVRQNGSIQAGRMRVLRDEQGRPVKLSASGGVAGSWPVSATKIDLESRNLEADWAAGALDRLLLDGDAAMSRGRDRVTATRLLATRRPAGWDVDARGAVYVQALLAGLPGLLRGETLQAVLDENLQIETADIAGQVTFEGSDTRAEAARARFSMSGSKDLELEGDERRKARLGRGRTRVAAERIRTDPSGERLDARGRVEATLLPAATRDEAAASSGLFLGEEAIHFVAAELTSRERGSHLVFSGSARGWQGERNLAAERIELSRAESRLVAKDNVSTRIPRQNAGTGVSEADYLQISADSLAHDDRQRRAVFEGNVRLSLEEGWLEARRVELDLAPAGGRIEEVRAVGDVRMEFHHTSDGRMMAAPISGTGDRADYRPAERTLRIQGERAPAAVRRVGEGGGTTTGRLLRYRLDLGTLEVESGEQGPARIRTPSKAS